MALFKYWSMLAHSLVLVGVGTKVKSFRWFEDRSLCHHSHWSNEPELIPSISWSDVMLYIVSTPSPYTKEAIKVRKKCNVER